MIAISTWWPALSWSHAALIVGIIALLAGTALAWALAPRSSTPREDPWPIIDYSLEYRRKARQLGSRYLLARPINRRMR